MKRFIIHAMFLGIIVLSISIAKPVLAQTEKSQQQEQLSIDEYYLVQFMEAIINRDDDLACELWVDGKNADTIEALTKLYDYWGGKEISSYKKISEEAYPADETRKRPAGTTYEYELVSGEKIEKVTFSIMEEYNGGQYIDNFKFTPVTSISYKDIIPNWFRYGRWAMILLTVIEVVYTFYISVLCIKDKSRLWGLWVVFILVAYGGITINVFDSFKMGLFVYTLGFPRILLFLNAGVQLYLSVPFGAIIYAVKRKKRVS